ncbi:MAG: thermonuclease family protein, partial [Ignavibacteria bacterium]|nr:thermonuclease family protein [Ignavibacteria bacterium]
MYKYKGMVLKVTDGDTFEVLLDLGFNVHIVIKIRFYGMNAPETRTRNSAEKRKGLCAKAFLEELILNKLVKIETIKTKTGKTKKTFSRYLALVYVEYEGDFINVGDFMIAAG